MTQSKGSMQQLKDVRKAETNISTTCNREWLMLCIGAHESLPHAKSPPLLFLQKNPINAAGMQPQEAAHTWAVPASSDVVQWICVIGMYSFVCSTDLQTAHA